MSFSKIFLSLFCDLARWPHLKGGVGDVAGPTFGRWLRRSDGENCEDAGLTSAYVVTGPAQHSPVIQLSARTVADTAGLLPHTDLPGLNTGGHLSVRLYYKPGLTGMSMLLMLLLKLQAKTRLCFGLERTLQSNRTVCSLLASKTVWRPGRQTGRSVKINLIRKHQYLLRHFDTSHLQALLDLIMIITGGGKIYNIRLGKKGNCDSFLYTENCK